MVVISGAFRRPASHAGSWDSTVCEITHIVLTMMNYSGWSTDGVSLYRTSSHTGRHHHRFSCAGDESTLLRCNYGLCSGFGDDAGVICYNG